LTIITNSLNAYIQNHTLVNSMPKRKTTYPPSITSPDHFSLIRFSSSCPALIYHVPGGTGQAAITPQQFRHAHLITKTPLWEYLLPWLKIRKLMHKLLRVKLSFPPNNLHKNRKVAFVLNTKWYNFQRLF
jgi:hypothetical protein